MFSKIFSFLLRYVVIDDIVRPDFFADGLLSLTNYRSKIGAFF